MGEIPRSRSLFRWSAVLLILYVVALLAALFGPPARGVVPTTMILSLIPFVWNTLVWRGGPIPQAPRTLFVIVAIQWFLGLILYLAADVSWLRAIQLNTGNVSQGLLTCFFYQLARLTMGRNERAESWSPRWRQRWADEWTPRHPFDLIGLFVAVAVAILVVTPIGTVPHVWLGAADRSVILTWWALSFVTVFAGGACILLLFPPFAREELRWQRLLRVVPPALASAAALYYVFGVQSIPDTWIVMVPSLWAGFLLRPWGAALHTLLVMVTTAAFGQFRWFGAAYRTRMDTETSIDLILIGCALVCLTVAMLQAELRRERTQAREQAAMLGLVLEEMGDGVVLSGDDGRIAFHNKAAYTILGDILRGPAPLSWTKRLKIHWPDGTAVNDKELFETGLDGPAQTVILGGRDMRAPGTQVVALTSRSVQRGGQQRALVLLSDVRAQIEREWAMRSFAGMAAHDLKGPLTALTGWLGMAIDLTSGGETEAARDSLARALASSDRMREIIDDWLEYSVVREGRVVPQRLDLQAFVTDIALALNPPGAGGEPSAIIITQTPHHIEADRAMIRQVFSNLITNAFKYAVPGQVPQVEITSQSLAGGIVQVEIRDHGIGVPRGEETRIFEVFHRAAEVRGGVVEGSGVGLALCRTIVEKHGGEIWAAQPDGRGAKICFTMPESTHQLGLSDPTTHNAKN